MEWINLCFGTSVDCLFIVPTYSYGTVLFENVHNWCCHSEDLVGAFIPAASNLSSFAVTLSLSANGTCQALGNQGLAFSVR